MFCLFLLCGMCCDMLCVNVLFVDCWLVAADCRELFVVWSLSCVVCCLLLRELCVVDVCCSLLNIW